MEDKGFETWAIVEVMGHVEYAGFVRQEQVAGIHMLRIDVPAVGNIDGFTKYIAPSALYAITPVTEVTAKARAKSASATPFSVWSVEDQLKRHLTEKNLLIERGLYR